LKVTAADATRAAVDGTSAHPVVQLDKHSTPRPCANEELFCKSVLASPIRK